MKILIIEDEAPAARRLQKLIEQLRPGVEVLEHLDSVESAVKWLGDEGHSRPDLIMMDIQLSDGLSFEIFGQVQVPAPVIFTTAYDEYALKAFKVNSIDYLLKPINPDELEQALKKFEEQSATKNEAQRPSQIDALLESLNIKARNFKNRFLIKIGDKFLSISIGTIAYFYTEEKSVYLLTHDRLRYPLDHSLDDLERMLDPDMFFRLNRQYLANVDAIDRLHSYFNGKMKVFLKPDTEQEVVVSRDKASLLKSWLDR